MISGLSVILISFAYLLLLFAIAYLGDKKGSSNSRMKPIIYSLSLAVYCSSWTFYGAVGRASTSGWEFLAIYLGPILVFLFGWRLIEKIIVISKQQNITTISDFISSRYGKSQSLAVFVTIIAILGSIPYLALQLKAVAVSFNALTATSADALSKGADTALFVALVMAVFAILFGTRHIDATEHHEGLVLAVAFESLIKLAAFIAIGLFVTFGLFEGVDELLLNVSIQLQQNDNYSSIFKQSFITETLLACAAVLCLPRQFHVTIVEHTHPQDLRLARWLFPLYLVLMTLFVIPISTAGGLVFGQDTVDADTYVLMLPLALDNPNLALLAFIGGLSASTSMVIVASIALATMFCNDIVMPLILRRRGQQLSERKDLGSLLLLVRRITIVCLMLLAYFYYRILGDHQAGLASFGLLAFVAAAQFFPALVGGVFWKTGSRQGVLAGLMAGFICWIYTLVLPTLQSADLLPQAIASYSNISMLTPTALFGFTGMDPLTHGVFWSLSTNVLLYVTVSIYTNLRLVDRIQASAFVDAYDQTQADTVRQYNHVTVGDLQLLTERFLGNNRTQHALTGFALQRGENVPAKTDRATPELIQFTERLLAGVIGASSARVVMSSTLHGRDMHLSDVVTIVDEASQALRFNRSLLQSTIENISLGISVVDQQMKLVAWNRRYVKMFNYPEGLICVGRPVEEVFRYNAIKGEYGPGNIDELVQQRMQVVNSGEHRSYERGRPDNTVLEVRGNPMPNGGYVKTYMDITEHKEIAEALRESEQNIRIYTDNVPVLIAYLDTQQRYLFVNKAYGDAFGINRHLVAGKHCTEFLSDDEYKTRQPFIEDALRGRRQRFELVLPNQTNQTRYAEVTYIPHLSEYGEVQGYFTLYQDITERRIAEDALHETNENLEKHVKERTHALSVVNKELRQENTIRSLMEDELRQAKSDAESANLGKTRFLAAASHDLLQPLNAARLFTSALAQKSHTDETAQLVDNLDGSLKAAEELITAILDISKLDAGALEPNITDFQLEDLFNTLNSDFTAMASEKHLKFKMRHCKQVVRSDSQLLRRILQNFLSNALRYTQHGGVLLGTRKRGNQLCIEVWDTGAGIADDKIAEVFEEFKRIDNPKHSQVQGLGLGLAITDRIARMLKHPLDVRSQLGKGTVFSITVPLGDPTKAIKHKPDQRGWIRSKGLNGINALVIDNEPKILEGMSALLNGWSCNVITALSAQEAIEQVTAQDFVPDIQLIDYHLSETDTGLMAMEQLQEATGKECPTIIITADRTDKIKQQINESAALLLTKPVKPAALRASINKQINSK